MFSKIKKKKKNRHQDLDQDQLFVGPDLGPNCLSNQQFRQTLNNVDPDQMAFSEAS